MGRPESDGNEEILAFLETVDQAPLDMDRLRAHISDNLAPYKRPARVMCVAAFPMTLSGKILKRQLLADLVSPGT